MSKLKKEIKKEERRLKQEWKNIIFNTIFAILTLLFVALFYRNIILTTILVKLVSIIGLVKWKSYITFTIFIFGALLGPVSEMFAIYFGAWSYYIPNLLSIPIWLFLVWGNTAAFLYQTALEIKKLGVKK